jgi:DUF4097 and DUF4098 domain-containing protein YvlB
MLATAVLALMTLVPTDQTVQVQKGTKLDVSNYAGDVNIKTWDKDAVRVEANHSDREIVDVKQGEQTLTIRSRSARGGPPRSIDYTISVPSWMAISISGTYADVTLEGVGGDVSVETTRGDITLHGGNGFVSLKSVQGEITADKAKGRIEVRSINESIHLADIAGDLSAETTNGSILLDRIDSSNVDLYTVNGDISYDGPIRDKGAYRLTTHNGMIAMALPEKANATLIVRTYNGGIRSTFPLKTGDDSQQRHKRLTMTMGNGSAHIELESFGGTIALRRPGEPRPEMDRRRRDKGDTGEQGDAGASINGAIDAAVAEAQAAMPRAMDEAMAAMPEAMAGAMAKIPDAIDSAMAALPEAVDSAMAGMPAAVAEALAAAQDAMSSVHVHPRPRPRR